MAAAAGIDSVDGHDSVSKVRRTKDFKIVSKLPGISPLVSLRPRKLLAVFGRICPHKMVRS